MLGFKFLKVIPGAVDHIFMWNQLSFFWEIWIICLAIYRHGHYHGWLQRRGYSSHRMNAEKHGYHMPLKYFKIFIHLFVSWGGLSFEHYILLKLWCAILEGLQSIGQCLFLGAFLVIVFFFLKNPTLLLIFFVDHLMIGICVGTIQIFWIPASYFIYLFMCATCCSPGFLRYRGQVIISLSNVIGPFYHVILLFVLPFVCWCYVTISHV